MNVYSTFNQKGFIKIKSNNIEWRYNGQIQHHDSYDFECVYICLKAKSLEYLNYTVVKITCDELNPSIEQCHQ